MPDIIHNPGISSKAAMFDRMSAKYAQGVLDIPNQMRVELLITAVILAVESDSDNDKASLIQKIKSSRDYQNLATTTGISDATLEEMISDATPDKQE